MFPARIFPKYAVAKSAAALLVSCLLIAAVQGAELKIKIPKRTKPTPVQQLNEEGVKALAKHDISRAKRAFYRAYLLDPDDPFTLNNLGYVAEIDGELERAQKFYELSAANTSEATVGYASDPELKGKQVSQVATSTVNIPMRVNRLNVLAMGLMMKDRVPEAEVALRKAINLDPKNAFTLNNLGYALEKKGELEEAVHYYAMAAESGSDARVVIALNRRWRGRSISEVAALNLRAAKRELSADGSVDSRVARDNFRGVAALNRGQNAEASRLFQEAYKLEPDNAFALNNMGYVAETQGDRESADFYYEKARQGDRSSERVALSSRKNLEGYRLTSVAGGNQQLVDVAQQRQLAALRAQGAPPLPLRTRDLAFVREPARPPTPEPEVPVRILSEYNAPAAPPTPPAMASRQSPQKQQQQAQPQQSAATPAPAQTTQTDDNTPLLPVIPDE